MAGTKRIAFVANTSWSIYKFRLYIIKELLKQGYAIFVLAPRDHYTKHFEQLNGLQFIELRHFANKKVSPISALRLYFELKSAYKRLHPHLIFHYTIKANIFGSLAAGKRFRCVSVITGLGYAFMENSGIQSIARMLYKYALRNAREVWFLNHDDLKVFTDNKLVAPEKTFVLPGEGIDTDAFYPAPFEGNAETVTFLMIGRLIKYKGIYEYVEAVRLLKQKGLHVECQVLGKFDAHIPGAISKEELDTWNFITYLGESDNVIPFIAAADCIVLPSYSEGMPLSLLEGSSMCKAIITTDAPGCRELVINEQNGYLCATKNALSLAARMEAFYHLTPQQKRDMGIRARQQVLHKYDKHSITAIYQQKIQQLTH